MFAGSIYCTLFVLDCFDFAHGYICVCVYSIILIIICLILQLPFVWGSSLVSHSWIFIFISLHAIKKHLENFCSWPDIKPWAFGVGALTPRPWTTRELTLGSIKYWELTQRKPLEHKTGNHPTTSSTLCRTPHLNNKQNKNTNPIISRQDYHLTQPCPSEEKQQQQKTQHKSHPIQSLHKPLDQP